MKLFGQVIARAALLFLISSSFGAQQSPTLLENFEPDIHLSLWSAFGGTLGSTVIATNYGGSVSGVNSLWFGDGGTRFATTIPVSTSAGGMLSFYLRLGNASEPWETVDIPAEGIVLEYSTNSGGSWTLMGTYDTPTFYSWTQVTTNIPTGALSAATQFRWRQLSHSGTCCDHWALDDISIDAGPTPPSILSQPVSQTVKSGSNVMFTVSAQGSFPLIYQWRKNGTNLLDGGRIFGAANPALNISAVLESDSGQYSIVITNNYGSVTSVVATLLVSPLDHFEWSALPSPQGAGVPFGATITAKDFLNANVTNFNSIVALSTGNVQVTNTILGNLVDETNLWGGSYTFGFAFTPNTNLVVTHVRSYSGTKISIWQTNGTLLASQNVVSVPGTWVETPLATPLTLNAGSTYVLGFYSGGQTNYLRRDRLNTFPNGTIVNAYYYLSSADGFPSNVVTGSTVYLVDLRYTVNSGAPVLFSPSSAGPFTNGVWNGMLTVQEPATNVILRANEAGGHSGLSNPFDVLLQNDLSISMTDSPDPVALGANLTYSLSIANVGPSTATSVTVTNVLPSGVTFVSANSSQGTCAQSAGVVTCSIGTVPGATNANVTIVVVPTVVGILTNRATLTRAESDPYAANNTAVSVTTVVTPYLSIGDASVLEGNSGQTNMLFAVQLSPASPLTVTVNYATTNGSAQAGSDYLSTNGILTFAPGETNHAVTVVVLSDTNSEGSETFFVNLSSPTNATLARSQAVGTIFDDDSITVAVFDNPLYVDTTSGGISAESDNVQASLTNRNFRVVTFTNIIAAASANNVLLFPEFEVRSLAPDLTLTERAALSNFVASGGLMIVHGQGPNAGGFINAVFGLAVAESSQSSGGTVYSRTAAAAGTHFADDPVSITGNNGQITLGLSSLPSGALSMYENSGQSAVAEIPFGGGKIIYLGWDWFDAVPIGAQDGGWVTVLESAVLELGPVAPTPPRIISQPGNQTATSGGTAAFTVTAAGTLPVSYQWRKGGTNLTDGGRITGVQSNRLTIANVQTNDAGSYAVFVSNAYGSDVSSNAMLVVTIGGTAVTVTITPASPTSVDNCIPFGANSYQFTGFIYRNVPPFSIAPGDRLRFDLGETNDVDIRRNIYMAQANVNPAAGGSSQGIFALGWLKIVADSQVPINPRGNNTTGDYELTYTIEAPFNFSGGGLIIGFSGSPPSSYPDATCQPTLVGTTATDASGSFHRRFFSHQEQDTGILDTTNSDASYIGGFIVESVPTPPLILAQPQSQAVRPGTNVALCVTAVGASPLSYQWRKNGTNLVNTGRVAGATDTCLIVSNVVESDSGQYSVVITNNFGSVTSSNATLLVTPLDHFEWSVIPSPQVVESPFIATITAKDYSNGTVTNFSGTVALSGSTGGQTINTILSAPGGKFSNSASIYTLGYSFTPSTDISVTHVRHYFGTKISIWTDAGVLLAARNVTSTPGTWVETALATPLQLTGGGTYRVGTFTGGGPAYERDDLGATFADGVINRSCYFDGDGFPLYIDGSRWWLVDLRYTVGSSTALPVMPALSGNFTNGIWSGNVTVKQLESNVVLRADDGAGHTGLSNPFDLLLQNDISVTISDVPDPVSVGANLTYNLTITNTGPTAATSVMLTNFLPDNATFSSATLSQGTYTQSAGVLICNLGTVPGATNATVTIVVVPTIAGTSITNVAIVARREADGYPGNNSATAVTVVTTPAISIGDAAVVEGDAGTTNLAFGVTLAAPSAQTITVNYATSDGTAAAGSDYVATNGSLTFQPGTTNLTLTVAVLGDKTVESNETFVVNLSSPLNGVLGRSQGIGTIINDDGLPGFLDHFAWNTISSPQAVGVPFGATITAKDFQNATVTNFNRVVTLTASAGSQVTNSILGAPVHTGVGIGGAYTLGYSFTPSTNITVTHVRHYFGTKVSIWTGGGILLASQNVTSTPGTWTETALATPIQLTTGVTYRVAAYTDNNFYYYRNDLSVIFPDGAINEGYEVSGDGFPGLSDGVRWWFVDLSYTVNSRAPVVLSPTSTGPFANGVWSGLLTVQALGTNVVLGADDGAGQAGSSNPFEMVVQNDISVIISDVPDPVSAGANLTYTLSINNTGPADATGVMLTNLLPANATFSSAAVSQGTYTQSAGVVICDLGTISGATNATVSIVVVPTLSGVILTNTAIVSRAGLESYLSNNIATALTTATPPAISIADATGSEGDAGTTNIVFGVTFATPSAQTITVDYATSDGTAVAGSDYLATNGNLTFPPGTTNLTITVTVMGDKIVESNETFAVNLSNPVNSVLGRSQAIATIINDDGLPGVLDHFAWNAISSPQPVGAPFGATIAAKDFLNATVTNFNSTVNLSGAGGGGQTTNTILGNLVYDSISSGLFTLGFGFTPNTNILVTHVRSYSGTKVSIWQTDGTLLASQNVSSVPGSWVETALTTPLTLTAGSNYVVGFYTAGGTYYMRNDRTNTFPDGTLVNAYYYTSADAYPSSVSTSSTVFLVDLRYTINSGAPVVLGTTTSGAFTNGIWSGNVTVQQVATNVVLMADDGAGHAGSSNPFDLVLENDLSVSVSALPDPVSVGQNLTYTLTITNTGPTTATSVMLTNFFPTNTTFSSAVLSQGTYTQSSGVLICSLGTVPGGTNATVSIVVVPTISGVVLSNITIVSRAESESYLSNNVATILSVVTPPAISVADATVVEGNVRTTNMLFAVTLNVPSAQTVIVNYATANGTAVAGTDYTATNGTVTFAAGTTNQSILVSVNGDTVIEGNETLFLDLFSPANGVLARSEAVGTITNDDGLPGQVDHFAWSSISSPQMSNSTILVTITALDASSAIITNFNIPVNLSALQGGVPINPTASDSFSNGVWSGAIVVQAFATNLVLRADDGDGHIGLSNPFHVITSNQPPVIIASPTNAVAYLGGAAGFQANILGSAPLSYQWRFNGTDIPAATNSTLNFNRVTLTQGGNYSVVVWNPFGTNSTAKATLSVLQVVAWGAGTNSTGVNFNYGQSVVPSGITNAIQLSGGQYHSLVVKADGTVSAWGAGATSTQINPQYGQSIVPPLGGSVASAGGGFHSLALRADGTLAAWGAGTNNLLSAPRYGQCTLPLNSSNIVAIAAGDYHSVALRNDGRVLVWGYNGFGQTNVPTAATSNVVAIASRASHVLALKSDSSLVHWGSVTSLPTAISNIVTIAAGASHCLALKSDGTVVSFGSQTTVPAGLANVVDIAAGADHNLALRSDGTVVTWGATNLFGRSQTPAGLSNFVGIACGYYHSLALLGDGSPVIKWQPVSRSVLLTNTASLYVFGVGPQLTYQWQLNGTNVPGATNSTYAIASVQAQDAGNYRAVLANSFGTITSSIASLTILAPIGAALEAPALSWSTSGNAAWFGETAIRHDGVDAAQSGRITDGQQSSVLASVSGPGALNFWWKVSSEQFFDYLYFFVDGAQQASVSGEVDWQFQTFAISSGVHTLKWTYQKDSSVSAGLDAGWLDQVQYTTNPPVITLQPIGQTNRMGATFSLNVSASGAPPILYQWFKAGTNVSGALSSAFNIINATRRDSATYSVVASNPGGSTPSSNAVVLIRVPQQLNAVIQPDGTFALVSADADGGPLSLEDLGTFESQISSNLVDWVKFTNNLVLTNGTLLLVDPDITNSPVRFYRMIEH